MIGRLLAFFFGVLFVLLGVGSYGLEGIVFIAIGGLMMLFSFISGDRR